jgi:hypothetical protein
MVPASNGDTSVKAAKAAGALAGAGGAGGTVLHVLSGGK